MVDPLIRALGACMQAALGHAAPDRRRARRRPRRSARGERVGESPSPARARARTRRHLARRRAWLDGHGLRPLRVQGRAVPAPSCARPAVSPRPAPSAFPPTLRPLTGLAALLAVNIEWARARPAAVDGLRPAVRSPALLPRRPSCSRRAWHCVDGRWRRSWPATVRGESRRQSRHLHPARDPAAAASSRDPLRRRSAEPRLAAAVRWTGARPLALADASR